MKDKLFSPHSEDVLVLKVPVPVPQIKRFSRWQMFLALFNPKAHFTTCDTLQHQLHMETENWTKSALQRYKHSDNP